MDSSIIRIDGSFLEGGGQILRNSASFSCLLNNPIRVENIRAGRTKPGLRPQHLSGLQLLRDLCGGKLEQGAVGSTEIELHPEAIQAGSHLADTHTAGSVCLLIQAALPVLPFANGPTEVMLKGGTNAEMAPQIDYFSMVFQPMTKDCGLQYECEILKRGYFPKGGGEVRLRCTPISHFKPFNITKKGNLSRISGRAFAAGVLSIKVAQIMSRVAMEILRERYPHVEIQIEAEKEPQHMATGNGTGIMIVAETDTGCKLAGSALGQKGVPAEKVGKMAADDLIQNLSHGGCVDEHLQDQLIIFMAIAKGKSSVLCGPLTEHTKTAIHVAEQMSQVRFDIQQQSKTTNLIECEGIGLVNKSI